MYKYDNCLLVLSRQTWLEIIQYNEALIEDISEFESNFEFARNLPDDSFESKIDNHDKDENISYPFLKKVKSKHPKNLFFGQLNTNSIKNKRESVQEVI